MFNFIKKVIKSVFFLMLFSTLVGCMFSPVIAVGTPSDESASLKEYHKGDIDGDNTLTSTDYLSVKKAFLGETVLGKMGKVMADIDNSGIIDSTDYLLIKSHFLGKVIISKDGFFNGKDASKFNCGTDEETYIRIKEDYISTSALYSKYTIDDVDITCFSGSYNGAYVMMISIHNSLALDVYVEKNVGGVNFTFPTSRELKVWKDGRFYSLEEAYEKGLLTTDDLGIACGIYRINSVI